MERTVCRIVTSDSIVKGSKEDASKEKFEKWAAQNGFNPLSVYVGNSLIQIRDTVIKLSLTGCRIVIVTGGTGISPRDLSIEAVKPITSKEIPGIGDIHRIISYNRGVKSAWASRVSGFLLGRTLVFVIPGNPNALDVLLEIITPRLEHILDEIDGKKSVYHR